MFQNTLCGGSIDERREDHLKVSVAGDAYLDLHYISLSSLCIFEIFHNQRLKLKTKKKKKKTKT